MSTVELLRKAREAVQASRNFEPQNGERFAPAESETLGRLCKEAYLACEAAGTTIAAERLALYREEREAHRQKLEAICNGFRTAALRAGKGVA
jgi:RNA-binding protein YlmH